MNISSSTHLSECITFLLKPGGITNYLQITRFKILSGSNTVALITFMTVVLGWLQLFHAPLSGRQEALTPTPSTMAKCIKE